jgi:hypothetical protein
MCTFDLFFGGELFSLPFGLYRVRLRLSDGLAALIPGPSPALREKGEKSRTLSLSKGTASCRPHGRRSLL